MGLRSWGEARLDRDDLALAGLPLSWLYRGLMGLRAKTYDIGLRPSHRLPGRVISIGNLVVGGTGKSPVVIAFARFLSERGEHPAILSRGYRSGLAKGDSAALLGGHLVMKPLKLKGSFHPDEGRMQSQALPEVPVVMGAKRFAAAQRYLASGFAAPSIWLLDDGFQHRGLARDFDLVLLDAKRPFGNGHVLPSGRLREPVMALRRADAVAFTRCEAGFPSEEAVDLVRSLTSGPVLKWRFAMGEPELVGGQGEPRLNDLHQPVLAVTAIAQPDRFMEALVKQGFFLGKTLLLSDHERIDRERLIRCADGMSAIVTTAKDYWRDRGVFADLPHPVYVVPLRVEETQEAFSLIYAQLGNTKTR